MDAFRFSPELFQLRAEVVEKLEQSGFQWLSHYSAVDCLHDLYGIEVCGIHEKGDALTIRGVLSDMFPNWIVGCLCYKDYGREPGWKTQIYRDRPRKREQWEAA
jgi:hypothetical protein